MSAIDDTKQPPFGSSSEKGPSDFRSQTSSQSQEGKKRKQPQEGSEKIASQRTDSTAGAETEEEIEKVSHQIREEVEHLVQGFDLNSISKKLEDFGRRKPIALAFTALTVGVAAGLLMRSTGESSTPRGGKDSDSETKEPGTIRHIGS